MSAKLLTEIQSILSAEGVLKTFQSGEVILYQDDPVDDIYYVIDGSATARNFERNGKESWINGFEVGDLISLENILSGEKAQCQITAKSEISVLQFKRSRFLEMMNADATLNHFVLEMLITQVKQFQQTRLETQSLSKRGQVASEIKRMAEPVCAKKSTYVVSPIPVISDMAMRLGIARETVSRTVSDLIKNRVLERGTGGFIVKDLARLEAHMR